MSEQSTGHNLPPIFSVAELSAAVKRTLEGAFEYVRVRGEISQPKLAGSGHCYLRLKDAHAVLDGVIWRGAMARLGLRPEEGMEVICTGRISAYPGRSTYQIVIERMELAGEGALLKMIEERRKRLAAEGLFDEARKRPLPYLPDVIGVVTSPTGAVFRDILHGLRERFPRHVLIWPVLVQGSAAADQVAAAIEGFNRISPDGAVPRPDVLIVARGGGSLEDFMAFNEETVVRAAAASQIPLISGVGHETDTTLIDFAADRRAPTPTAAAEMAVPVRSELMAQILAHGQRMLTMADRSLRERWHRVDGLGRGLPDPRAVIGNATQRFDQWSERLTPGWRRYVREHGQRLDRLALRLPTPHEQIRRAADRLQSASRALAQAMLSFSRQARERVERDGGSVRTLDGRVRVAVQHRLRVAGQRLGAASSLLESFSFARVLERGFVLVRNAADNPVTSVRATHAGEYVMLQFHDGLAQAVIAGGGASQRSRAKAKPGAGDRNQGRLL